MATNISSIYDRIVAVCAATFPSKSDLPNGYIPEDNDDVFLKDGYGVSIEPVINDNRIMSCQISFDREVSITLTKKIFASDRDISARRTVEKALMEDELTLIKAIVEDATLHDLTGDVQFLDDNGIEFVFNGVTKISYIMLQLRFGVKYIEGLQ
jgi:hypothetical protein